MVECIANFPIDAEGFTRVVQERGYKGRVVSVPVEDYEARLLKKKGSVRRLLEWVKPHFLKRIALDPHVDRVIFFNLAPKVTKKYDLSRLPKEKVALFLWEPKTVLKDMYLPSVLECFSQVFTWDDAFVDGKKYFKFHYPVLRPMRTDIPSFEEKKLCTLVATQLHSSYPFELYSERTRAIAYFEEVKEEGFEFYGRRWNPTHYSSYRGAPEDKVETIKDYRFVLCYENTSNSLGYVTEKIFDCFAAGVVPIYWGAPNISDYIPKECYIDRREFASMEELHRFMKEMSKEDYEGYLAHIRDYLASDKALCFNQEQLYDAFYRAVIGSP